MKIIHSLVLLTITLCAGSAFGTPFTPELDEFWIVKNNTEIFRDSFADDTLPPSGPDGPLTYSVLGPGGITSEAAGKLTMTPSLGAPIAISSGITDTATGGLRFLSTDPVNPNFLGFSDAFEIHGLYDMSNLPATAGQNFGIRATDRALNAGNLGNNTLFLTVSVDPITSDVVVNLLLLNFEGNAISLLGSVSIESLLPNADQIELILTKAANSAIVSASFSIFDIADQVLGSDSVGTGGTVYIGEDYIRAQFASADQVPVPEPATLALFALGLAGVRIGDQRRKQIMTG